MKIAFNSIAVLFFVAAALAGCKGTEKVATDAAIFTHVTLIDGNGGAPFEDADILVQGDTIVTIGHNLDTVGVKVTDLRGKFVMPALTSTHVHVGTLKGTKTISENYTLANILAQLKKYGDYGVLNVLAMGTDRPLLFANGLYDSLRNGQLPGARMFSVGYGFGAPRGAPPMEFGMDRVYRPSSPEQIPAQMDSLLKVKPEVVKIWLDDFAGKYTKMNPAVYKTIIDQAHKRNLRVAAHAYYLADARQLVADGVDIIGHSVRDSIIDDALVDAMKAKNVVYIPTLSLDEFAFIYARKPEWINDPFFKASLEPGVYEMITSEKYQTDLKNSPAYVRNAAAFETALKNLKKIYDAGILVSLGTDSGATPIRAQGFSEHLELELMVQAGLTPLQAITVSTKNAALVLKISEWSGTLEKGKIADFIVLAGNPADDIRNTRNIQAVYKAGKPISKGPLEEVK